jgi:hypothetical protein
MLNENASHDPEVNHEPPKSFYAGMIGLLPLAVRTKSITEASKEIMLRRFFIHDHDILMRFFITIIRSPECMQYVEELDCHVDLTKHASAERLGRDMAMLNSVFRHLRHCSMSRELLACMHKYSLRGGGNKQPYDAAADIRFRQAVLLSLLAHLRRLTTLHITINCEGEGGLRRLGDRIIRVAARARAEDVIPCADLRPYLKRVSLDRRGDRPKKAPRRIGWRWG